MRIDFHTRSLARRDFLKASVALLGLPMFSLAFPAATRRPLLSFSTLACPDWSFAEIMDFAANNHYDGIEMRGILQELELAKCVEFNSKENILSTMKKMQDRQLRFSDLGTSAALHHAEPALRRKNLDEAKRYIDLAQQLACPYIRVFPNELPREQERETTITLITEGLIELGKYAEGSDVSVLMESHGELTIAADLEYIMRSAAHSQVGLIWDVINMWSVTKESPVDVYAKLKKYIHHVHLKDMSLINDKQRYVLLGKGQTPIFEAVDVLYRDGYRGYYSFEWEKRWHPEIEEPEIALADYAKVMRAYFANLDGLKAVE